MDNANQLLYREVIRSMVKIKSSQTVSILGLTVVCIGMLLLLNKQVEHQFPNQIANIPKMVVPGPHKEHINQNRSRYIVKLKLSTIFDNSSVLQT